MKILKFCDWNYKDMATNHTNVTKIELIDQDKYYKTYADVFGKDTVDPIDHKRMFNDYGQQWDRSSLRKDFNFKLTKSKVIGYNDKRLN
jgi:transposase